MTVSEIFTLARFLTNTNSTTATDANLLVAINEHIKRMTSEISLLKEGYGETSATYNVSSSLENYALPADALRIKRIEVTYDGSDWSRVNVYDLNELDSANDTTEIGELFSTNSPHGDISGDQLYLRPIPDTNVTNGLKIWYVQRPSDIAGTTLSPSLPQEFHRYLAEMLATDIRQMKEEITGSVAKQEVEFLMQLLRRSVSPRVNDQDLFVKARKINYE